jgi:AmiR/NasT family two-component response regulator
MQQAPRLPVPGRRLRVLVANEEGQHLDVLARLVDTLGEDVVARARRIDDAAHLARQAAADVALVGLGRGESSEHALGLIAEIVRGEHCPVVVVSRSENPRFLARAARLGIYAHTTRLDPVALRSAIDVALQRFAQHTQMKQVASGQLLIERAKGVLMERYGLDDRGAFELLRRQSRNSNLKLAAGAEMVVATHRLLPAAPSRRSRRFLPDKASGVISTLICGLTTYQLAVNEFLPSLAS